MTLRRERWMRESVLSGHTGSKKVTQSHREGDGKRERETDGQCDTKTLRPDWL